MMLESDQAIVSEKADVNQESRPGIFSVLGWLMGSLSFLNLLRDFTPLKLYGLVSEWVGAYGLLVNMLAEILFGWIDFRWISISHSEGHILVLGGLICAAFGRGMHRAIPSDKQAKYVLPIAIFWVFLLMALILPGTAGTIVVGLLVVFYLLIFTVPKPDEDPKVVRNKAIIRTELVGVLIVTGLVVILNYTLIVR